MAKMLHQIATLYVNQYGYKIYARSVEELKEKAGPGAVRKMYRDTGKDVVHCGYCVGDRWFEAYAPVLVPEVPVQRSEKDLDRLAMGKARRLVAKWAAAELYTERETGPGGGWWVTSKYTSKYTGKDDDPIEGNAFCTSGREVLETVKAVVEYHKAQA